MMRWSRRSMWCMAVLAMFVSFAADAQTAASANDTKQQVKDAFASATQGPADVPLDNQGAIKLPAGYAFIARPHAANVLRAMGNPGKNQNLSGLVFPTRDENHWFVVIRFNPSGYVKDDDAKDWDADDLLKSYREGTEAANEERKKMGVAPLEVLGWAEKPTYDAATHRLAWAMSTREKGAPANEPQGVNYNTYALGREGYFSLNLVTELDDLPKDKPHAAVLLSALQFNAGKRYSDFNASTDRVAEYGLAALVAGVAAKKLGLFAVIAAFLAKFAKVILIAGAALGAGLVRFFRRGKAREAAPGQVEPPRTPPRA